MAKYRKKPVVIDAVLFDGTEESILEVMLLGQRAIRAEQGGIFIDTLEGKMLASKGDYIIKGIKGEIYPCKPDIFEATYEKVDL